MKEKNKPLFSIVIPIMEVNDYLVETCEKLQELENQSFETVVVSNKIENVDDWEKKLKVQIIPLGNVSPAIKRDKGVQMAKGKYIAFIDDDAYPTKKWLDVAKKYLKRNEVAIVGGTQLTPPNDDIWQKISGAMFLSPLSGAALIRFWPSKKEREVDDWPTVNFFIKKKDFEKVDGFDNEYWPGEDTKLCLDVIQKLKKKIIYAPGLIVFHHRRAGLKKHLKQTGNYGLHRGHFARKFPQNSARLASLYFMPSLWVAFLFGGLFLSYIFPTFWNFYLLGIFAYLLAVAISMIVVWQRIGSFLISLASSYYLVLFHLWYGIRFVQGYFFTKNLKSKLGR